MGLAAEVSTCRGTLTTRNGTVFPWCYDHKMLVGVVMLNRLSELRQLWEAKNICMWSTQFNVLKPFIEIASVFLSVLPVDSVTGITFPSSDLLDLVFAKVNALLLRAKELMALKHHRRPRRPAE